MSEWVQIALAATAACGMTLLLAGLFMARRGHRGITSRLSAVLQEVDSSLAPAPGPTVASRPADAPPWRADRLETAALETRLGRAIQERIAAAGLPFTVSQYLLLQLVLSCLMGLVLWVTIREPWVPLAGTLSALYLPWWYLGARRARRRQSFTQQLADTVSMLVSSLRAGQSLLQALERTSRESPEPTAGELRRVALEMNLGVGMGTALRNLAARVGSRDLDLLVAALEVQREVGGDILSLMESMGDLMRERHRIKAEVRVITSQQRLASRVMFAMPVVIGTLLFVINPRYLGQFFSSEALLCGLPVFVLPLLALLLLGMGYVSVAMAGKVEV